MIYYKIHPPSLNKEKEKNKPGFRDTEVHKIQSVLQRFSGGPKN
jgi:hypothetical protein